MISTTVAKSKSIQADFSLIGKEIFFATSDFFFFELKLSKSFRVHKNHFKTVDVKKVTVMKIILLVKPIIKPIHHWYVFSSRFCLCQCTADCSYTGIQESVHTKTSRMFLVLLVHVNLSRLLLQT